VTECPQIYLILKSLNPKFRMQSVRRAMKRRNIDRELVESKKREFHNEYCLSKGIDQGFHNWLLYSGDFQYFLGEAPTAFKQGDGFVSTLGRNNHLKLYFLCK
jgi:hypothetical protein